MSIPAPARKSWQRLSPLRKKFFGSAGEKSLLFFKNRLDNPERPRYTNKADFNIAP